MNIPRLLIAVFSIWAASGLAKFANQNYEQLKIDGGLMLPLGLLILTLLLVIYGIRSLFRSFSG